jgi:hypothetical protein
LSLTMRDNKRRRMHMSHCLLQGGTPKDEEFICRHCLLLGGTTKDEEFICRHCLLQGWTTKDDEFICRHCFLQGGTPKDEKFICRHCLLQGWTTKDEEFICRHCLLQGGTTKDEEFISLTRRNNERRRIHMSPLSQEEFEIPKGVIRIRKSKKDRQHNGQKKNDKRTNNDRRFGLSLSF